MKKLNEHFPVTKLQHLKRVNSSKTGRLSVILWEYEEAGRGPVSRHEEEVAERLSLVRGLDLTDVIEDDLVVASVASFQPLTTEQFNRLRQEEDYW